MTEGAFAGDRVLADPVALGTLRRLADDLRAAGYANGVLDGGTPAQQAASELALGHPVARGALDGDGADALLRSGAADLDGDHLRARFALFALGGVLVLVPRDGGYDPGRVYFGRDTLWLADFASRIDRTGGAFADLGTGAGTVAALLAGRFDTAVATDILGRTAACAAVTFALNPRPDGSPAATACVADVAGGLTPGAFSLVTGNPPWVPDLDHGVTGPARVFAEGGSTGFELPRRFIMEGVRLLAPDGVMVMLALDVEWEGGERPLRSLARGLLRLGFEVSLAPTDLSDAWGDMEGSLRARFPSIAAATHVALVVHRRAEHPAGGSAAPGQSPPARSPRRNRKSGPSMRWVTSSV